MPDWSPDTFQRALRFAAEAHAEQLFPGTKLPYLLHVMSVAMEVVTALASEPVDDPDLAVQCALLHDVVEDTPTPLEVLRAEFGEAVAAGVLALTKREDLPKPEAMRDSLDRILRQPREVACVKLADRIANLEAPPYYWTPEKIDAYREEARLILQSLGAANAHLARRLAEKIARYPGPTAGSAT